MTAEVPVASSIPQGGNIEDRMASVFSAKLSTDSGPSQTEPAETIPEQAQVEPEPQQTETEPSVVDPADTTAPEPELADQEEIDPYADLDESGDQTAIEAFLKTPRGREVYANHKLVEQLAKPTTQGGIGHVPSVQQVKQYFKAHRDAVAMGTDFTSGDPARVANFFAHWFGADQNGQFRPSSMAALQHLEPTLARIGPEAYERVAAPVLERYQKALVADWRAENKDPELKRALLVAAHVLHNRLNDEWLEAGKEDAAWGGGATMPTTASPGRPGRAELDAEWQQLNQAKQASQRQLQNQWDAKLDQSETATLSSEIDKALKPLADMRSKTPEMYEALKERMAKQIRTAVQADPELWNLYQAKVELARRTGNPAAIEGVMKEYLGLAGPVIREKRGPFLKGAGVATRKQSDDRHAQLRSIASHTAPANNGAPVRKSIAPASSPKPGESKDDYMARRFAEAMQR